MIDRGALVLAPSPVGRYRGVQRPALDAQAFTGRRGRDLAARYRAAVVAGEGVIEDLDEAIELQASAKKLGLQELEVVVFEVPQEPLPRPGMLPLAVDPPASGLVFLGHDVIEPIEPFCSPLAVATPPCPVNVAGLVDKRADADALARELNAKPDADEPMVAVRVWLVASGT